MKEYKYNNLYEIEERKQLIAVALIKLRTENAKKQKEIAEIIGVKPTTYNTYEKGKNEPPAEVIVRLAQYYGVSCDEILDKDNMFKNKEVRDKNFDKLNTEIQDLYQQIEESDKSEKQKEIAKEILRKTEQLKNFIENVSKNTFDDNE